jgi:hypothetical protein
MAIEEIRILLDDPHFELDGLAEEELEKTVSILVSNDRIDLAWSLLAQYSGDS